MIKLIALLSPKRKHFWNRLKKRKGSIIPFLFSKIIDKRQQAHETTPLFVYRYKHNIYLVQNNRLQTYINKLIPR